MPTELTFYFNGTTCCVMSSEKSVIGWSPDVIEPTSWLDHSWL
jgi:hypothetical protein